MNRKSPHRHKVSGYNRNDGTKVRSHERGKGSKSTRRRRRNVGKRFDDSTKTGAEAWNVTFHYKNGKSEKVMVIAETYEDAMDEAFEERRMQTKKPIRVDIVDPGLLGAIKGAMAAAGKRTVFTAKKYVIQGLLKDAYADEPQKRASARIALKMTYPEIYELCDFSRERYISTRGSYRP